MTRQQTEKMKAYEEKAKELVSLTLNVCEERLTQPVEPTTLQGDALASAAMSVRESVNTFIAVSRLSVEEK
ncbi:MAG: hypothetical protein F8N36_01360 [Desulfovibrio sp.]|jgi:hypothetical protein|uniref:hypothetical protein n=1 Tax=Desulfovibrionaceae TaxID=194924 RepID=UPI00135D4262|nr:hypothetical protein [Desulfovibrio sp.]MTJ91504.1 hypothetical protein [Desulfovibrio sp.]